MSEARDENDKAQAGTLPSDPRENTRQVSDAPKLYTVRDLLEGSMRRAMVESAPKVCTTGMDSIDRATGGLLPGWCWVVGGATNWGKSMFAVHLADENLQLGERLEEDWQVLIVSAEDSEELYGDRLMCRRARVSADRLRLKQLTKTEMEKVTWVASKGERKPVFLDARDKSAEWAAREVVKLLDDDKDGRIKLVIFDYVQEFRAERRLEREPELQFVAKMLRGVVKRRNRACVLLSQLNDTQGKLPTKDNLAECKAMGKGAEVVALGFTPAVDVKDKDGSILFRKDVRYLHLDKVKQGRAKWVATMRWNDTSACFEAIGDPMSPYDKMVEERDDPAAALADELTEGFETQVDF